MQSFLGEAVSKQTSCHSGSYNLFIPYSERSLDHRCKIYAICAFMFLCVECVCKRKRGYQFERVETWEGVKVEWGLERGKGEGK